MCCWWRPEFAVQQYILTIQEAAEYFHIGEKKLRKLVEERADADRVLRNGESQRSDGRYAYKYIDTDGKQQFVYSWKLEKTDRLPKGKRDDLSLREKEKQIQKDMEDMISTTGGDITVYTLVEKYTSQRKGMRHSTKAGYKTVLNILAKEDFGRKQIKDVRLSDAKEWLIRLQENGKGYSSIQTIRGVVRPAFQMAVDDDLIRRNPFEFHLSTVVVNDSVTREAITRKQERQYLEFVKNDKHFSRCLKKPSSTNFEFTTFFTTFQRQHKPGYAEKPDEPGKFLKASKRPKIKKNHDKLTYARS